MYRRLVAAAQPFAVGGQVSVLLANYKTASQLALDCNLPQAERNDHKIQAINHGCALGSLLTDLTRVSPANS